MEEKFSFKKYFLIFRQEDPGFGAGQEPSGHIKIEVRDGHGKAQVVLQNITELKGNKIYRIYLIGFEGGRIIYVPVGSPKVKANRSELVWEFDPVDVSGMGKKIDSFNTAVLLAEEPGKDFSAFECPMAAYKGQKTLWREKLHEALKAGSSNPASKNTHTNNGNEEIYSKYEGDLESIYMPNQVIGIKAEEGIPEESETGSIAYENAALHAGGMQEPEHPPEQEYAYPDGNSSQGYFPGMLCPLQQEGGCNGCTGCNGIESRSTGGEMHKKPEADIEMLKKHMNRYFEPTEPFRIKRRDYKWWKVGSPPQLNNFLYQCNIRSPILFNPKVISAHFKYRHMLAGIYTDLQRRKEYIVCGIPGVYELDERPFGELCRWVQVEGHRPKYGAFGYWIAYVDPGTGKLMELR